VYALITGISDKTDGIKLVFGSIIKANIPLWFVLLMVAVSVTIVYSMIVYQEKKQPEFLKVTSYVYNGLEFQWVWKKDKSTGKYKMSDFLPVCPQCNNQLRVEMYDPHLTYHCSNNHHFGLDVVNSKKEDLVHMLRRKWMKYADIIEFPKL
jgi:hypothetical protein